MSRIRVLVAGACGRMGREVLDAVRNEPDLLLVGAVDAICGGEEAVTASGLRLPELKVEKDLARALEACSPDVMVDFTVPDAVFGNMKTAVAAGVSPVVGTTGLNESDLKEIDRLAVEKGIGVLVAPNFAIGAVLMMKCAAEIAPYMQHAEIIEYHHDRKLDAPSGTALKTAEMMRAASTFSSSPTKVIMLEGARGGEEGGINIHSVRLPGYLATQEVIFGGLGQTLTIRHDTISRQCFMPGVILGCRRIRERQGLVCGLEKLL